MKDKDFNLCEKKCLNVPNDFYMDYDVKEFIRRLKEDFTFVGMISSAYCKNKIDKLSGEDLR